MARKRVLQSFVFFIVSVISFPLLAGVSFPGTTIHVPKDQPTIEAGINAGCVGDKIIIENYETEISESKQIINGKAVELVSEDVFFHDNHSANNNKTTFLYIRAERPPSIQSEFFVRNEVDSSCPFPPVPVGVEATLVERKNGGVTNQANFYIWTADGKLYINISPVTASFEILPWAYDKFYVVQDGFQREVFLKDCSGQLYNHEIVIFAAQTFEIKDDPDWTGADFNPTQLLTLGFTAMNGDDYSWDVGTGTPIVIPPVPAGVTPTFGSGRTKLTYGT